MTSTTIPTRVVDGIELPVTGTWKLDPGHAEVGFVGRHFMLTKVRGRFRDVTATVTIADNPSDSSIEATIQMASVESGDDARDEHLRSGDLFEVETHPTATFRSTAIMWSGDSGTVTGDLTIKGVTKRIDLATTFLGAVNDPWGGTRAVFDAAAKVNREDFGVTWNMPLEAGGVVLSKEIDLVLHVELVLDA